jgi:hypothetical protein
MVCPLGTQTSLLCDVRHTKAKSLPFRLCAKIIVNELILLSYCDGVGMGASHGAGAL